jgi:hypothetical protein
MNTNGWLTRIPLAIADPLAVDNASSHATDHYPNNPYALPPQTPRSARSVPIFHPLLPGGARAPALSALVLSLDVHGTARKKITRLVVDGPTSSRSLTNTNSPM